MNNDKQLLEDYVDFLKTQSTTSELPYGIPTEASVEKFLSSPYYFVNKAVQCNNKNE